MLINLPKSLDELTEKEMLKVIISGQAYLLYRLDKLERKVLNENNYTDSDEAISIYLDKVVSFEKQINSRLTKMENEG